MKSCGQPTKEQVREWLAERRQNHAPLPSTEDIRRQLGWDTDSRTGDQFTQPLSLSEALLAA